MAKTTDYHDDHFSLGLWFTRLTTHGDPPNLYHLGEYQGPEGTVTIYRQPPSGGEGMHVRTFYSEIKTNWPARVCRKFIADVAALDD